MAEQIADVQRALTALGYDVGPPDGIVGRRTREAIAAFQKRAGLPVTGEPSLEVMQRLADALQGMEGEKEHASLKECRELLVYQQQLTGIWRATVAKYSLYQGLQGDLRRMRDELLDDAPWGVYTWRENTALILQGLNTVGRLTRNLTTFMPQPDIAATTVGLAQDRIASSDLWLGQLRRGENIRKVFQDESEKLFFDLTVRLYAERTPTGKVIKATTDLAEDLVKLKTMPKDFASMREQLADGISQIDRNMRENEERLLTHYKAAAMIEALSNAIDAYCKEAHASEARLP